MNRPALIIGGLLVGAFVVLYWQFAVRSTPASADSVASFHAVDTAKVPPSLSGDAQRAVQTPPPRLFVDDDRPFSEARTDLERQAKAGDGHAALRLGMVLANCNRYVPISDDKFESMMVELFASGVLKSDAGPDELMRRAQLGVAQTRKYCSNVSGLDEVDASSKAFQWVELGASLGNPDAQAMYATLAFDAINGRNALADAEKIQNRKRIALDYLDRSLAQGDALALQQLSIVHGEGFLFPADAEVAYGYLYAFSLTSRASDYVPGVLELLLEMRSQGLDAAARVRAQEVGQRLASCCMAVTGELP